MRLLLVDNSNTRTKFALAGRGAPPREAATIPTRDLSAERITETLAGLEFDAAVASSVVPEVAERLRSTLAGTPLHLISHRSRMPIAIDYPNPSEIGADRLANSVAAMERAGAPSIVIDFGTAVTFDVIGEPGCYLGGTIAPGLASMTESLHRRTALLPAIELAEPKSAIGKSTVEAMQSGAIFGYRGMIREILATIRRELPGTPAILATGGDADLIARGLPEVGEVVPGLTLRGIQIIGEANL